MNVYEAGKKLLRGAYTQFTPSGKNLFVKANKYGKTPHVGDIVYFYSQNLKRVAHVGIVIEVIQERNYFRIKTVEGNTSADHSFNRNGGCVAIKSYSFNSFEVGDGNRIDGFGTPFLGNSTCDIDTFLKIAKSEVGYIEKASNIYLDDKKANVGDKNFTKYGKWYGGNGLYWCQQFVSWVAYQSCKKYQEKNENKWIKSAAGWQYIKNGELVKGQWENIENRWYVFDDSGNAIKGWFKAGDLWYFLNEDDFTMIAKQWLEKDGKWYYFDENGVMARSCYVRGKEKYHWIDEDGVWKKEDDTNKPDLSKYESL